MPVAITSESSCDLFPDLYKEYGVDIVPLYITVGSETYRDFFEYSPSHVFDEYARTHVLPKTAAPAPTDYYMLFKQHVDAGEEVVHISMNAKMSASYQNATLAAREFSAGKVRVIDSRTTSSAQGLLVLRACDRRDAGQNAAQIADAAEQDRLKVRTYVLLDTLEYAYKGGRATMLQRFGANLLHLRPCLLLNTNGDLSVVKKFRGNFPQVCREYTRFVLGQPNADRQRAFVSCTSMDPALFADITQMVRDSGKFDTVLNSTAGCAMTVHVGPNTLVVFYMEQ